MAAEYSEPEQEGTFTPSFVVKVEVVNPDAFINGEHMKLAVEFPEGYQDLAMRILKHAVMAYEEEELEGQGVFDAD